jgi:hypothetical protein
MVKDLSDAAKITQESSIDISIFQMMCQTLSQSKKSRVVSLLSINAPLCGLSGIPESDPDWVDFLDESIGSAGDTVVDRMAVVAMEKALDVIVDFYSCCHDDPSEYKKRSEHLTVGIKMAIDSLNALLEFEEKNRHKVKS